MKTIKLTTLALCLGLSACATKHPGIKGKPIGAENRIPVQLSAKVIDRDRTSAFQLIDITVENLSDTWVRVNTARVVTDEEKAKGISAVVGPDLLSWAESMKEEQRREKHNDNLLKTGIVLAGTAAVVAGHTNRNSSLETAGIVAVIGTYSWAMADALKMDQRKAQSSNGTPEDHIYSAFSVPGKLLKRRWLLLNKPSGVEVNQLVLELETVEGVKQSYVLSM